MKISELRELSKSNLREFLRPKRLSVAERLTKQNLQSGAKILRLFAFLAIFKYVGLPSPPMINVGKSGLNFLFSVIHTTLNWG